jgi:hypothetical protein
MDENKEAEPEQLDTARWQGDAYGRALQAMVEEDGAAVTHAGHYLVALVREQAEGMYAPDDSGRLVWREAPEEANAHIEVAVADGADGRFVPGLDVTVTVLDGAGAPEPASAVPLAPVPPLLRLQRASPGRGAVHGPRGDRATDLDAPRPGQRQAIRAAAGGVPAGPTAR